VPSGSLVWSSNKKRNLILRSISTLNDPECHSALYKCSALYWSRCSTTPFSSTFAILTMPAIWLTPPRRPKSRTQCAVTCCVFLCSLKREESALRDSGRRVVSPRSRRAPSSRICSRENRWQRLGASRPKISPKPSGGCHRRPSTPRSFVRTPSQRCSENFPEIRFNLDLRGLFEGFPDH
jgi:hypothetical protein